jgi:hypothetical protein
MNTLLIGPDPESGGFILLAEALREVHRHTTLHSLAPGYSPKINGPIKGAASNGWDLNEYDPMAIEDQGSHYRCRDLTLSDTIDLAFLRPDLFIASGTFDQLFIGVDLAECGGVPDCFRTTTVAAGLLAGSAYGVPVHVFLQQPSALADPWANAADPMNHALRTVVLEPGITYLTQLPARKPLSVSWLPLAHYSKYRTPNPRTVPRANDEKSAITALRDGTMNHARLQLRLNPEMRY